MKARWMRTGIGALVAMASLVPAVSFAANLATPTATVTPAIAAAPAADGGQRRSDQAPAVPGGKIHADVDTFEGGLQVGTTAAGASKITFLARGTCLFDLPAIAAVGTPIVGPPVAVTVSCAATGAAVGDSLFATLYNYPIGEYKGLLLSSSRVSAADTLEFTFTHGSLAGLDAAPLTVNYLVVR